MNQEPTAVIVVPEPVVMDGYKSLIQLYQIYPAASLLILCMIFDFITGLMVAFATKTVSSSVSYIGMCKKGCMLIIWGVCAMASPILNFPLGDCCGTFFLAVEIISIIENSAKLGVPIPPFVVDTLIKLKTHNRPVPLAHPTVVETHIHTEKARVEVSGDQSKMVTTLEPETNEDKNSNSINPNISP